MLNFIFKNVASNIIIFVVIFSTNLHVLIDAKGGRGGGGRGGGGGGRGGGGGGGRGSSGGGGGHGYSGGGAAGAGYGSRASGSGYKISATQGALAGLATGYVAGSLATRITSSNYGGTYEGRYYYYGDRYYPGPGSGRIRCSVATPASFPFTYADTGARITELVYECGRSERCCDDGCCSKNTFTIAAAVIFSVLGLLAICGGILYYCKNRPLRRLQKQKQETNAEYPSTVIHTTKEIPVSPSPPPVYGFGQPGEYANPGYTGANVPPPASNTYPQQYTVDGYAGASAPAYPQYPHGNGTAQPGVQFYPPPAY